MRVKRLKIIIEGRVQGVGFRPTAYRYAMERRLSGWVANASSGVVVEIEGEASITEDFLDAIKSSPPPRAVISRISVFSLEPQNDTDFIILPSMDGETRTQVSPDIGVCEDCVRELFDRGDRRYRYPFINCTNCGPRLTIIEGIPYDRPNTTMKDFKMRAECEGEYRDPTNRRFHAQPNACPVCGPHVFLKKSGEEKILSEKDQAIGDAIRVLKEGKIVAIKGIGGFHLACDATNEASASRLRQRKRRYDKPFALMAGNIDIIRNYCFVSPEEESLLSNSVRPIVLLEKRSDCVAPRISEDVAPNNRFLGFTLPYSPLHFLLFEKELSVLVMTSGNISQEPISYENEEAFERLKGVADYFLAHNRDIYARCDDSVTRVFSETKKEMIIRRSRGYAPAPLSLPVAAEIPILACGGHDDNAFALARENEIILSHHTGDLENLEALEAFEKGVRHFKGLFEINPKVVACDTHPEYLSTKYAHAMLESDPRKYRLIPVQHHHAHIASCMADNRLPEQKVIGVAFDGSGFGLDGAIWGGEFLIADYNDFERIAHLKYLPLPGGEAAIREPWRMAAVYLFDRFGADFMNLDIEFTKRINRGTWGILERMIDEKVNSPLTSSAGRLFDAVSALIGIRDRINYQGQAAIELEMAIEEGRGVDRYDYDLFLNDTPWIIDPGRIIEGVVRDLEKGKSGGFIARKFHNAIIELILDVSLKIREEKDRNAVALSGGVFQNMYLTTRIYKGLRKNGFEAHIHRNVPANDGGLCLGQAAIAAARIREE